MASIQKLKTGSSGKKMNGKNSINPKSSDYIIYTQIEGMCNEFESDSIKENLGEIRIEHFFPFVHKVEKTFGYLLKLTNEENYRILSQANWRSILNGRINKLRPADNLPENNRIKAFDNETEKEIEICYWPDNYYNSVKKSRSNGEKKSQKSNSNDSGENKSTKKIQQLTNKTPLMKNALENSSFGFLIASVKKTTNTKNQIPVDNDKIDTAEITDTLVEHLFKNDKKRKRSNKFNRISDSSDEIIETSTKKQKLSDSDECLI